MKLRQLPLLPYSIAYVREERYSDDSGIMNVYDSDVEDSLKMILINTKKIWRCFDYKCYSNLGGYQNMPCPNKRIFIDKDGELKAKNIVSFKEFKSFKNE